MSDEPYSFGPTYPGATAPDAPYGRSEPFGSQGSRAAGEPFTTGVPAPWGAKQPVEGRKQTSAVAKSLTAVGVAALIAVGGTVAVTSANADNGTASVPSGQQPMVGEGGPQTGGAGIGTTGTGGTDRAGGFGGGMASRSLIAGALHGEFVVADGTGTVTERLQTGAVTAISSSSLAVKSTDGFAATYTVPSGTNVSSVVTGTTVTVVAKVDGSAVTLLSITASAQGGTSGGIGGFTPPNGSMPGRTGTDGSGTGGTGTAPGGTAPGSGGSSSGAQGEDSGV